jgi:hypothetical protein
MSDPWASLDVARCVHRHLLKNLGIKRNEIIPGNFYVLRKSSPPSILCEPSYLTNKQIASLLVHSDKQRLEAEALFLGIVEYFSKGIPQIQNLTPNNCTLNISKPKISALLTDPDGAGIDPSTIILKVNGEAACT